MEHLRNTFQNQALELIIEVQKPAASETPKIQKPLSNNDKLLKLYEKNPLIKELAERFTLRFDDN